MSTKKILSKIIASNGEEFNLYETGLTEKGQLERFLKLVGIELDHLEGMADAIQVYTDVDKTDADYLPLIAELVGLQINYDIPIPQQREEIKRAVEVYKKKGTVLGIARVVKNITGMECEIGEWSKKILVSNKRTRTSSDLSDRAALKLTGLPGDPNFYSMAITDEGYYGPERYGIYIYVPNEKPVLKAIIEKLNRVVPSEYAPASLKEQFILIEEPWREIFDTSTNVEDDYKDEETTKHRDYVYRILTSNNTDTVSNDINFKSMHYGVEEHGFYDKIYRRFLESNNQDRISNQNKWRSASIFTEGELM